MLSRTLSIVLTAGALLTATAQAQVQVFGGSGERAHATRFFFTDAPVGGLCIQYGQPEWKAEYDAMIEGGAKSQNMRLGKDYWTTLHTDLALDVAGTKVPAGSYFLGLTTDEDGGFWLAILDAKKALKNKAMPFSPPSWKIDMKAQFTHAKVEEKADKLQISLDLVDADEGKLTLKLHWGNHALTAPVHAHLKPQG